MPFTRLEVLPRDWKDGVVGVLIFRGDEPGGSGLGGMLAILPSFRGGCGNELMLTVFRNLLCAEEFFSETDLG